MKKTLIALAALAATSAFAQSSVQLYGGLDAGYQALNFKGNKVNGIAGNGASTSALFVKGTEDLGGGFEALGIAHHQLAGGRLRGGAAGAGLGPQGAQGAVGSKDQGIEAHGLSLLMTNPSMTR